MTDNDIIKILENEADFDCGICCDNGENCIGEECASFISRAALDLINRQNAEIARLQNDVAPVRHGWWGHNSDFPDRFICYDCGAMFDMWKHEQRLFNYCPNCGAKMDGDADAR